MEYSNKFKMCNERGCYRVVTAKGLCNNHYTNLSKLKKDSRDLEFDTIFSDDVVQFDDQTVNPVDFVDFKDYELKEAISESFQFLTDREVMVIKMRFGLSGLDEHTLRDIGKYYDFSEERVRQILNKAIRLLRHPRICKQIKEYWEGY